MATNKAGLRSFGSVVGIVLLAVAVYSVVFVDWTSDVPPKPPVVRPAH